MRSWIALAERERLWCLLPFFHINAQAYSLMAALANGYPLTVSPKFRALTFWRDAAALDVTQVNLIGAMVAILANQPGEMFVAGPLRAIYAAPALEPRRIARSNAGSTYESSPASGCRRTPSAASNRRRRARNARASGSRAFIPTAWCRTNCASCGLMARSAARGEPGELQFRNPAITPGLLERARDHRAHARGRLAAHRRRRATSTTTAT